MGFFGLRFSAQGLEFRVSGFGYWAWALRLGGASGEGSPSPELCGIQPKVLRVRAAAGRNSTCIYGQLSRFERLLLAVSSRGFGCLVHRILPVLLGEHYSKP